MRYYLTSFNKNSPTGLHDGWFSTNIVDEIDKNGFVRSASPEESDMVFVYLCHENNFEFDFDTTGRIEKSGRPVIVFDYFEYGGCTTHREEYKRLNSILTEDVDFFDSCFSGEGHQNIRKWLYDHADMVKVYFKRELSNLISINRTKKVVPVDFCNYIDTIAPEYVLSSFEEFSSRIIQVLMLWGMSNYSRPLLHGKFMSKYGELQLPGEYVDSVTQFENRSNAGHGRLFFLAQVDYNERVSVYTYQYQSLISIDMHGCGCKCFRNTESAINCVSAKQDMSFLEFAYPWIDGETCIVLPNLEIGNTIDAEAAYNKIISTLKDREKLYQIYLNGNEHVRKYNSPDYVKNHIIPHILG